MPDLLHEYWENDDGGEFGPVRKHNDEVRAIVTPGARHVFSLRAAPWREAMQLYNDCLGYGEYRPVESVPDHFYTEEEAAEQHEYLRVRDVR